MLVPELQLRASTLARQSEVSLTDNPKFFTIDSNIQKRTSAVHPVVVVSTALMIVGEAVAGTVGMAVVATMTAIADLLATMTVSVARMGVVMTMALAALIGMHQVGAMIVTAVAVTTTVAVTLTADEIVDVLMLRTAMLPQETVETRTVEVETKTTALTIGTPADELRSANPLRCGALCQIMRPNLSSGPEEGSILEISVHGEDGTCVSCYGALGIRQVLSVLSAFLCFQHYHQRQLSDKRFPSDQKSRHHLVSFDSMEVRVKYGDGISASSTELYWLEL